MSSQEPGHQESIKFKRMSSPHILPLLIQPPMPWHLPYKREVVSLWLPLLSSPPFRRSALVPLSCRVILPDTPMSQRPAFRSPFSSSSLPLYGDIIFSSVSVATVTQSSRSTYKVPRLLGAGLSLYIFYASIFYQYTLCHICIILGFCLFYYLLLPSCP